MESAVVVRGRMGDPRHIELAEAVPDLVGEVEVVLRSVAKAPDTVAPDVFEVIASLSAGTRSKEEIDQQLADEHASWGDR